MYAKFLVPLSAFLMVAAFAIPANAATAIKVSYNNQPGEPIDKAAEKWAEWVKEASDGELVLQTYPAAQLGEETEVTEQAQLGAPIIAINSYSNFYNSVPDLSVIDAPYLADSFEQKMKLFDSDWFKEQAQELADKGYHIVVPNVIYGERELLSTMPVTKPEDLKGVKIRVQNSQMYVETVKSMGAVATPMGLGDVYPAMAQGIVQGVENPPVVLEGGKFYEQAKHLNMTGHMKTITVFVAGEAFWNQLSESQQDILEETGARFAEYASKLVQEDNDAAIEKMKENGVEVHEVDKAPFQERARQDIPKAFTRWSPDLYETVQKIIND